MLSRVVDRYQLSWTQLAVSGIADHGVDVTVSMHDLFNDLPHLGVARHIKMCGRSSCILEIPASALRVVLLRTQCDQPSVGAMLLRVQFRTRLQ